jgi:DNA-binding CsgD family transcriptional regulator/tetratricopeptide (TPR) repeat protein
VGEDEGISGGSAPAARHIIERPRLTRLLDQTEARLVALVAPAGYGKTTLARQWLAKKPHIWFRATPACSDIAALVQGLADAVGEYAPNASGDVREFLASSQRPECETEPLTALLVDGFRKCPPGLLLAVDDYHYASTKLADEVVHALVMAAELQLVATSRERPGWATARRLLYGQAFELDQRALAMAPDEANEVLASRRGSVPPGLAALAQGWPAVLGLAALTEDTPPAEELPDALYDFFAEELYQSVDAAMREKLTKLALVPVADNPLLNALFGAGAPAILESGIRIGFVTREVAGHVTTHPLARSFLEKKLQTEPTELIRIATETAQVLISEDRWDDAFTLIERFELRALLEPFLVSALHPMLKGGRLSTLDRLIAFGRQTAEATPVVDLLDAEVSFCRGAYERAETLALRASKHLPPSDPLLARAHIVAGHSAHLSDREEDGMEHHSRALEVATRDQDKREALWGKLICANQLSLPVVEEIMDELESAEVPSPVDRLRIATMRFVVGLRGAGVASCLHELRKTHALTEAAADPMARTAFLNAYSRCLSLGAHYSEASAIADELITDAQRHRLEFALPHGLVAKALAEAGANRFSGALRLLDDAERAAIELNDLHNQIDARAIRCRIFAMSHDFDRALSESAEDFGDGANPVVQSEFWVSRSVALLGVGRKDEAIELAKKAQDHSPSLEIHGLARWLTVARAVELGGAGPLLDQALGESVETGVVDGFVVAYRTFPDVLALTLASADTRDRAMPIFRRANDAKRMRDAGVTAPLKARGRLSPREKQVSELVVAGHTNKEIAASLFISEVTVKVHVRHILDKIGARSRTEAAARLTNSPELLDVL